MSRKNQIILLFFMLLFGCKRADEINEDQDLIGPIPNHYITLEKAIKIAIAQSIYPESLRKPTTKSDVAKTNAVPVSAQKNPSPKSIESSTSYKGDNDDPTMHIINYKEGGFVIIAADDRSYPLLAYSDKNKFIIQKSTDMPWGVLYWQKNIHAEIKAIRSTKMEQSSAMKMAWKEMDIKTELAAGNLNVMTTFPECITEGQQFWDETLYIAPMISSGWDQKDGWNNDCPVKLSCTTPINSRAFVGCVALSIGQIMYYHQSPNTFNYSAMSPSTPTAAAAAMLADIGPNVSMDYGCDGNMTFPYRQASGAWDYNIDNGLAHYGYSSTFGSYNYNTLKSTLVNGYPAILTGDDTDVDPNFGHAWVASGVKESTLWSCHIGDDPNPNGRGLPGGPGTYWTESAAYKWLYMNWGWGGGDDGWYGFTGFTPIGYNIDSGLTMVTSIHP